MIKANNSKNSQYGRSGPASGSRIFQIIRTHGPLSRAEIVMETGLSKSSVSLHVDKLMKIGLVKEDRGQNIDDQRKRRRLKVAEDAGFVIGIDLGATSLDVALCNLEADVLSYRSEKLLVSSGPGPVMEKIISLIKELLKEHAVNGSSLFGMGMGVPGPVEFVTGQPVSPPIMPGWHRYDIRQKLTEQFGCVVFVDNDVNVMARGEKQSGAGKSTENFIFVKVGTGIGAGIISGGKLYRGTKGCAGDIGHIGIDGEAALCPCGNKGCLEIIAAGPAIAKSGKHAAEEGRSEYLSQCVKKQGYITAKDVGAAADHGDLTCLEIIKESGRTIGSVLSKLVNFFNPSLIVLGGGVSYLGDIFIASIREVIYTRSLPLATSELMIKNSELINTVGMIGAAAMALDEIFSHGEVTAMVHLHSKTQK